MRKKKREDVAKDIFASCMINFGNQANDKINEEIGFLNWTEDEKEKLSDEISLIVSKFIKEWKKKVDKRIT